MYGVEVDTMIKLKVEWQEEPGVSNPVLANTWARLEIIADNKPVIRYWIESSKSIREGVYGSVFPLAKWLVTNWKYILSENISNFDNQKSYRAWLRRHNVIFAREGMAYPDLSIYSDGDSVCLCWRPDPDIITGNRFLGEGTYTLPHTKAEAELIRFIESVLERTSTLEDEEVVDLRNNWRALQKKT
jgi:hypothetical protein